MDGDEEGGRKRRQRRVPKPLDRVALNDLALHYVARFATSRAKLSTYLKRKLRERGWDGEGEPDLPALVAKLTEQGFVDDRAFAEAKGASLTRRGFGGRRVRDALSVAGIAEEDRAGALEAAEAAAWQSALRFAQRKRIGPYAEEAADRDGRAKALSAMMRAGHGFELARRIVAAAPGELPTSD
ncbi:hypothetical protein GCM10022280_23190 [Sphingomonas swuensis]|uniref:Regulatory protein RecX n=1 Tax=Sphingomonas swuensis TaxID=977800 RepID=A0ABP7T715_9SPHN